MRGNLVKFNFWASFPIITFLLDFDSLTILELSTRTLASN